MLGRNVGSILRDTSTGTLAGIPGETPVAIRDGILTGVLGRPHLGVPDRTP